MVQRRACCGLDAGVVVPQPRGARLVGKHKLFESSASQSPGCTSPGRLTCGRRGPESATRQQSAQIRLRIQFFPSLVLSKDRRNHTTPQASGNLPHCASDAGLQG